MPALLPTFVAALAASALPAAPARPPLQVVSALPAFVAPGGLLGVRGWTGRAIRVRLTLDGQAVAETRSGRLGGFTLRARAPRPGRYAVGVTVPGERRKVGILVVRPLVLAAAGDVTFGSDVAGVIAARGARYPWLSVAPLLSGADLATANLEGTVSTRGAPVPNKSFTFRGPPSALEAAAQFAGIDLFSVANNHSLDYGRDAFFDTLALARRAGIAVVGGGRNLAAARRPAILVAGGLRVAFLGYSDINPPGFVAGPATAGTTPAEPGLIAADVRRVRRQADLVVVWFHWGIELNRYPDGRQQALAGAALNAGASVVLGAHPHVLQPIGRPGRGRLVAWSLGNFVFPPHSPGTDETGVLRIGLDSAGVRNFDFRPARIVGVQPQLVRRPARDAAEPSSPVHLRARPAVFSPNGDGRQDLEQIRVATDEEVSLTLQLVGPHGLVVQTEARRLRVAPGSVRRFLWDGTVYDGLRRGVDGLYTVRALAVDALGNRTEAETEVRVDTRAPVVHALTASARTPAEGVVAQFRVADADGRVLLRPVLFDGSGTVVRTGVARGVAPGHAWLRVALRDDHGAALPPSAYRIGILAADEAGNDSDPSRRPVPFLVSYRVHAHVWGRFEGVGRRVALTFDDCYEAAGWAGVLDVLAREQVEATFFCSGRNVLSYPALALRTVRAGHVIGSHGWDHASFDRLSYGASEQRMLLDRNVWWRLARVAPTPYFRPPYARYTPTTVAAAGDAGYAAVVLWDVDPSDYLKPGPAAVAQRVLSATRPGSIILMHTLPGTAAALPTIISTLRARGYGMMTLPQLAALGRPTPGHWR